MTDIVKINHKKLITMPADEAITKDIVSQALKLHLNLIEGYKENEDLYLSKHKILMLGLQCPLLLLRQQALLLVFYGLF